MSTTVTCCLSDHKALSGLRSNFYNCSVPVSPLLCSTFSKRFFSAEFAKKHLDKENGKAFVSHESISPDPLSAKIILYVMAKQTKKAH